MSEGALIVGKFIAALAVLSEAERARVLDVLLLTFPDDAQRLHNRERMRTKRAQKPHTVCTEAAQSPHTARTDTAPNAHQERAATVSRGIEGGRGESLSSDSRSPDLENLPLSGLSSGDLDHSPGARESGVVPTLGPSPHPVLAGALLAFEAGVTKGRGERPFAVPRDQREDLLECIRVHGRDTQGPFAGATLQEWLRVDGEAFAAFVRALPSAERERQRWNYNPRAFLRWLNDFAERAQVEAVDEVPNAESRTMPVAPLRRVQNAPAGAGAMFGGFAAKGGS